VKATANNTIQTSMLWITDTGYMVGT